MALYNPSSAATNQVYQPGLIAQYAFTETTGTNAADSSGSGNNATYVGSPTLTGAGVGVAGGTSYVTLPNGVWTAWQTAIIFCDSGTGTTLGTYNTYGSMMGGTTNAATEFWQACAPGTSSANYCSQFPGPTLFRNNTNSNEYSPAGPTMFTAICDLSNTVNDQIFINDHQVASYSNQNHTAGTNRGASGQLGASNASNVHYMNGTIYYVLFYSTRLTSAQIAYNYYTIKNILLQRGNIFAVPNATSTANQVVGLGDSITYGLGLSTPNTQNWLAVMSTSLTFNKTDLGMSSVLLSGLNKFLPNLLTHAYTPYGGLNILVIFAGTNDMATGGLTAVQAMVVLRIAIQIAKAGGWKVIVCSSISRASIDSKIAQLAPLVADQWRIAGADDHAPLGYDPYMGLSGSSTNTTYFQADDIHPTAAGQIVVGSIVGAAINRITNDGNQSLPGAMFISNTVATVANTTTATTLYGAGLPSAGKTIPVYFWWPAKALMLDGKGIISTAASPGTLTITLKMGSTVVATTSAFTPVASLANNAWYFEAKVTCVTMGSIGTGGAITNSTLLINGNFFIQSAAGAAYLAYPMINTAVVSIDTTTAALAFDVQATWQTASASNTISSENMGIYLL